MISSKTLLLPSFQFFRDWYQRMKARFTRLTLRQLKINTGSAQVRVTVVY